MFYGFFYSVFALCCQSLPAGEQLEAADSSHRQ